MKKILFLLAFTPLLILNNVQGGNITKDLNYIPGELIVRLKDTSLLQSKGLDKGGIMRTLQNAAKGQSIQINNIESNGDFLFVEFDKDENIDKVKTAIESNSMVKYAEPNYIYKLYEINTNDPKRNFLRGLDNEKNNEDIDRVDAYELIQEINSIQSLNSVNVGVIDDGVNYSHEDLSSNIGSIQNCKIGNQTIQCTNGYNFINDSVGGMSSFGSHGTHIAGTIAAVANNTKGIIGVNPLATVIPLKVSDSDSISIEDIIKAINFSIDNGIKIINASRGSTIPSDALYEAISNYKNFGGLLITAAGNAGEENIGQTANYPCSFNLDNIICVGASNDNGSLTNFSNYGTTHVDIAAPGKNIYSTIINKEYNNFYNFNVGSVGDTNFWNIMESSGRSWNGGDIWEDEGVIFFDDTGTTDGTYLSSPEIEISLNKPTALYDIYISSDVECINDKDWEWLGLEISTGGDTWVEVSQYWEDYNLGRAYIGKEKNFRYRFVFHDDPNYSGFGCAVGRIKLTSSKPYAGDNNLYGFMDGTSMATPHVVGLASLAWMIRPDLDYGDIRDAILNNGDILPGLNGKVRTSSRINAYKTLVSLDNIPPEKVGLLSPVNNENYLEIDPSVVVNFLRDESTDRGGAGIKNYHFELSKGEEFNQNDIVVSEDVNTTGYTYEIDRSGTYYWRVKSIDNNDNNGEYSDISSFVVTTLSTTPNDIEFETLEGKELNTVYESSEYTISGINVAIDFSIDTGEFKINDGEWTSESTTVYNLDKIKLRITSSSEEKTTVSMTVNYGNKSGIFSVTTKTLSTTPNDIEFEALEGKELNTVYESSEYTISGIEKGITLSIDTGEFKINDGERTSGSTTVYNLDKIKLRIASSNHNSTTVSITINYGNKSGTFKVTTKADSNGGGSSGGGSSGGGSNGGGSSGGGSNGGGSSGGGSNGGGSSGGGSSGGGSSGGGNGGGGGNNTNIPEANSGTNINIVSQTPNVNQETYNNINTNTNNNKTSNNDWGRYNNANPESIMLNGYSVEFNNAYTFAHKNGITTMNDISKADMNSPLNRIAMAKMLANYAINILGKKPANKLVPKFPDITQKLNDDYGGAVDLAYQLGIMGIGTDKFRPYDPVTRKEFGTALSRMLFGLADGKGSYFEPHLKKLKEEGIIANDNPDLAELRGYVMLMLMRSAMNK